MCHLRKSKAGLSPLARGTRRPGVRRVNPTRFIPAGAGNTWASVFSGLGPAVYPRWRGEHCSCKNNNFHIPGLSPLARGTQTGTARTISERRFIPAGAGNTGNCLRTAVKWAVYPRWRGEHAVNGETHRIIIGLSPLARGTRRGFYCSTRRRRFIPAGAGNTRLRN
ncbi:Domain of uncharacterised function (DUF2825) [Salmonella enterica subsp. enterica]|nr:Domain of uncharacterised function (DUF2825) [Salmonella enterica subsp. enterica]